MLRRMQRLLRMDRLERRLFGWLLILTLTPTLLLLGFAYALGTRSLEFVGTLGPWDLVAESGRAVMSAAEPAAATDPELARALERHRRELSESVVLARRWSFLAERLAVAMPWAAVVLAAVLAASALWVGRRLSLQLARPIKELAGWADRLADGTPLPAPEPAEAAEVREVRALRSSMRLAADRLREARSRELDVERTRAWGEMARRVAHEMKNPLTPLRLAAHRLVRMAERDPAAREPVEVIAEETARLEELARQFAVLGRPSAGVASEVDVRELLESLMASDLPPAVARRIDAAPDLPLVHGYYDALQRTFRNLLRNAVEAIAARHPADGRITARIEVVAESLRVTIADNGIGIPAEKLDRLFEPDFTLKSGGTGLGLAVVHQAVAAHGGTVWAQSGAGGGAAFVVELPRRQRVPTAAPAPVGTDAVGPA